MKKRIMPVNSVTIILVLAVTFVAGVGLFLSMLLPSKVYANHVTLDGKTLLFEGSVTPDYELDDPPLIGNAEEFLPVTTLYSNGVLSAGGFASYHNEATNNKVTWQIVLSGQRPCSKGAPIAAKDVVIAVTEFPPGTEFPNAHDFVGDGDPLYSYGIVKCTETLDDYRVIQMIRPNSEEFTVVFQVYGSEN